MHKIRQNTKDYDYSGEGSSFMHIALKFHLFELKIVVCGDI